MARRPWPHRPPRNRGRGRRALSCGRLVALASSPAADPTYANAITTLSLSIGAGSASGTSAFTSTTVTDNKPSPGPGLSISPAAPYDEYFGVAQGFTAPPLGGATLMAVT